RPATPPWPWWSRWASGMATVSVTPAAGELPRVFPTVVHMLVEAAAEAPDREALVCGDERLSYAEYLRCVAGFAAELREAGAEGQRVALVMGNSPDICIATFATHMAGAQVVPLNPLYTAAELGPMLRDAEVRVLVCDTAVAERVEPVAASLGIPRVIRVGPGARRLTEWRNTETPLPQLPSPDDPATLQFTGGTTGLSKG